MQFEIKYLRFPFPKCPLNAEIEVNAFITGAMSLNCKKSLQ